MSISQKLSVYGGNIPNRAKDTPIEFADNVYNYQVWFDVVPGEVNTAIDQINTTQDEINEKWLDVKNQAVDGGYSQEYIDGIEQQSIDLSRGFKNLLINGNMKIWQESESFTIGAADQYCQDMWLVRGTNGTGGSTTVEKLLDGSRGDVMKVTVSGHTDTFYLYTYAENATEISGETLTLSLSSAFGTSSISDFTARLYIRYGTGGSESEVISTVSFNSDGIAQFNVPDLSSKVFGQDSTYQILISSISAMPDQVFKIWDVQLEKSSIKTSMEVRGYGLELSLCQRYYEIIHNSYPASTSYNQNFQEKIAFPLVTGNSSGFISNSYVYKDSCKCTQDDATESVTITIDARIY